MLDKCAIYIDGGYLSKILKRIDMRIDFTKLGLGMSDGYNLLRAYYYTCMPYRSESPTDVENSKYDKMDEFIHKLKHIKSWDVRLGRLQKITTQKGDKFTQKMVDIMLGVDVARMSWDKQIDKAIIMTGDSDFTYAIKSSKDAGVYTHLWHYENEGSFHINEPFIEEFDEVTCFTKKTLSKYKYISS